MHVFLLFSFFIFLFPPALFKGLAKEFVVPGWRLGWLTIHDAYVNMSASMRYPSSNHTGSRPMDDRNNAGQFYESNNSQSIYNNATAEQSNDTANEFNSNGCKFNYLGKRGTNNYNIINGKNSYSNYRNTDSNIHNESIVKNQDYASATWPRVKNPCVLNGMSTGNEHDNKINLQEYHMNGTVDIDELLINYINQNDGVAYMNNDPDIMSSRVSPADYSNITEDQSDIDNSKMNIIGTNNRQTVFNVKTGRLTDVRKGLRSLTQLTLGESGRKNDYCLFILAAHTGESSLSN